MGSPTRPHPLGNASRAGQILAVVRAGARLVVPTTLDPIPTLGHAVPERLWNSTRGALAATYGAVPQGHELRRQYNNLTGEDLSWPDLVKRSLVGTDVEHMTIGSSDRRTGRSKQRPAPLDVPDRLTLYEIVGVIAILAGDRLGVDPARLTREQWNAHRRPYRFRWRYIPKAHEICGQLSDYWGTPIEWATLLTTALEERLDLAAYDAARRCNDDEPIAPERAQHAVQRAAHTRGVKTVEPDLYAAIRAELLASANRRSSREERLLRYAMPPLERILFVWDS